MDEPEISSPHPHVLMFPLPSLGDMSPMLKLAQLFCLSNLKVTFINTVHNHKIMKKNNTDFERYFSRYPEFEFKVIPDGLPEDHPRVGGNWLPELLQGLKSNVEPFLRETLFQNRFEKTSHVTCLIADSVFGFAFDAAEEARVPVFEFMPICASFLWIVLCSSKLLQEGEIPVEDADMDLLVQNVSGMKNYLRRRDLPSIFRVGEMPILYLQQFVESRKYHSTIINTFEELEGPILSLLQPHFPNIYSIGPLHAHLEARLDRTEWKEPKSSSSFRKEDRSCISWLDNKPFKSVVYVSFGSLTILTRDQLVEIWAGLVKSNKYFLWVVRPDMITGSTDPDSLALDEVVLEGSKERGLMVGWAPQEEVLAHRAVGGFMTHSGWNSTLESIIAGVPMLCWPCFYDQQVNSRHVSEVWKIGLDMKDTCNRSIVENMVIKLMDGKRDELQKSMGEMSEVAKKSVVERGSSYCNLIRLIEDIKLVSKT